MRNVDDDFMLWHRIYVNGTGGVYFCGIRTNHGVIMPVFIPQAAFLTETGEWKEKESQGYAHAGNPIDESRIGGE